MFEYDANGYPQQFFTSTPNGTNGNTYFPPPGIQVNFDASALSHMYPQQGTNVHAYQQCVPHQADGSIPTTATSIYHPMSTPLGYGTNRQSLSPIVSYANNVNVAQEQSNNDSAAFRLFFLLKSFISTFIGIQNVLSFQFFQANF